MTCGTSRRLPPSSPCRTVSPMSPACGRTTSSIRSAGAESFYWEYLPRIKPVVGIERTLERAGEVHLGCCAVARQLADPVLADTVLRRDAAAESRHHVMYDAVHDTCILACIDENVVV